MTDIDKADLVSVREAAPLYRVSRATLVRWIADGKIKPVKRDRDRLTYVKRADLMRVMSEEPAPRGRPGGWRRAETPQEGNPR